MPFGFFFGFDFLAEFFVFGVFGNAAFAFFVGFRAFRFFAFVRFFFSFVFGFFFGFGLQNEIARRAGGRQAERVRGGGGGEQ